MQSIKNPKLSEILPRSLSYDEKFLALSKALDAQLEKLSGDVKNVLHLPRLDELEGKVLDLLLWQFHADNVTPLFLDDLTKRNLIRNSISYHRKKGTRAAVNDVLAAFGNQIDELQEWFEADDMEPYWFRVTTDIKNAGNDLDALIRRIWDAKNVRSWLILRLKKLINFNAYVGIGHHKFGTKRILKRDVVTRETRRVIVDLDGRKFIIDPDKHLQATAFAGVAHHKFGRKRILKLDTVQIAPKKITDILGTRQIIIEPGKVTLIEGDQPVILTDTADKLQLKMSFPTGSRTITFNNPRSDLTADDINAVADYAIDNDLLIKTNELDTADDLTLARLISITKTPILF